MSHVFVNFSNIKALKRLVISFRFAAYTLDDFFLFLITKSVCLRVISAEELSYKEK